MTFIVERTRLAVEKYRDEILLIIAVLIGVIPDTGTMHMAIFAYAVIPALFGTMIAVFYRFAPLSWKVLLALILSCCIFILRWFLTWFAVDWNLLGPSALFDWQVRRRFLLGSLFGACGCVIPLHFVLLFFASRRMRKRQLAAEGF